MMIVSFNSLTPVHGNATAQRQTQGDDRFGASPLYNDSQCAQQVD